jgi:leucine dehydrogenase
VRAVSELQVPFDHELVIARHGPRTGYRFVVAIHSTAGTEPRGRAGGGCRLARYADPLDGLHDALRLSEGMSRKAAIAGTRTGGAKCVIAVPPGEAPWPLEGERREAVLRDLAEIVDSLDGRYLTGPDVGTTPADMEFVHSLTPHAAGFAEGGTALGTAVGVHACMRAAAAHVLGDAGLAGVRVTIVGLGGVGEPLARRLAADGARLAVTDIDPSRRTVAEELGAEWIELDGAQRRECEIVAPCALGATLTQDEAAALRCRLVVGAANNQLAGDGVAAALAARGIAWVPDFVANAGGLLYAVTVGRDRRTREEAFERVERLGDTALEILRRAEVQRITTLEAAVRLADERLAGG